MYKVYIVGLAMVALAFTRIGLATLAAVVVYLLVTGKDV